MIEKYILDNLNQNSVSVKKQTYILYKEQQYPIGEIWRRAYVNSDLGRQQVSKELPSAQINAILAVWGDEATFVEEDI
ncbi:hypothetical protein JIN86_18300 [Lysinibacillus sp. HST-98]|uniref:hypothetical protein n=1 Tax=Lysinibacillus sp. HST-98 TaxID=2800419 RepID=UPI001928E65C|nr:hypothetical protein [Lysinibacillus sp. HST-98]MBL3731543.1 hypothetical protein [Lysinibacillus sp. HST-98]